MSAFNRPLMRSSMDKAGRDDAHAVAEEPIRDQQRDHFLPKWHISAFKQMFIMQAGGRF